MRTEGGRLVRQFPLSCSFMCHRLRERSFVAYQWFCPYQPPIRRELRDIPPPPSPVPYSVGPISISENGTRGIINVPASLLITDKTFSFLYICSREGSFSSPLEFFFYREKLTPSLRLPRPPRESVPGGLLAGPLSSSRRRKTSSEYLMIHHD